VTPVKPTRAERALQTRLRMLHTARDQFVSEGYPATTMERIAAQAGVAVQTLYYTFRTKAQMLCEVMEVTAASKIDPVPVNRRSWMTEAMATPSPHRALALCIEHGTDIFERAAPLWPAIWAASATDPYVERYWERVATGRRAGMSQLAARLADLGALRDDITPARATDVLFVLISHETFRGLVQQAAWTLPAYKAWLFTTLVHQLIRPSEVARGATSGLSFDTALHEA
jgi:TetR/AcrR family transcriptional regulator of autoinduction and epiphytic fitness